MALPNQTGGQMMAGALKSAGVTHCFGVPGESFLGLLDALYDSSVHVISARHEGGASFMALGFSKISGQIGVCFGTRAVGSTNLAIGVHTARQDSTPMIAIAGQVNRSFAGREAFQEADLVAMMRPLSKWATQIPSADRAAEIMARAINVATTGRPGPVFLAVPQDVCDELCQGSAWNPTPVAPPYPDPRGVDLILEALLAGRRPLIFAGGGLYNSAKALDTLVTFAEAAEIPVISSWRHHDEFPNDHRLFLGSASLGTSPVVWERLDEADVVLVLGNRMQELSTDGYRFPLETTRLFQVDIDPTALVSHRAPEFALQADGGATLAAMLGSLPDPVPGAEERRQQNVADRQRYDLATALPSPQPAEGVGVSYAQVMRVLADELGPEVIIASDAGNFYGWLATYHRFRRPHTYVGPASGAMGYGLPSAIGAKIARPDVPVVSLSGDGGFVMTMAEVETAVRNKVNVVAIVLDNERQGTIRMHQEARYPSRVIATDLGAIDFSQVAQGLGAQGFLVTDDAGFAPALTEALEADAVSVIHVRMDKEQLSVRSRLKTEPTARG
jgi:acetolactate synthase I/II/III large subunit